jgi:hypothetical protein
MTAQAREIIYIDGKEEQMAAEPLAQYLSTKEGSVKFAWPNTACWRGYYGTWKLEKNKLFLVSLSAYIEDANKRPKKVGLEYLFPGENEVFASWFSGIIKIELGELLEYVHAGYASVYEKDRYLVFEDGVKVDEYTIDNKDAPNPWS